MDVCEAFCVAVKLYRSGEWSLSLPARNLDGNEFTLRHVCSLVEHNKQSLPDSVVSDLFTSLRERHPLLEKRLGVDRTYALGAGYLLRLMGDSEKAFRLSQMQADKAVSRQRIGTMERGEVHPQ